MSDFVAVLKKTLDGLGDTTPEMRQRVYEKARSTISAKLEAMSPPPSSLVANRQRTALEDAIVEVERGYKSGPQEPLDELEQVLNSLNGLKNQPVIPPKAPAPRPVTTPRPVAERTSAERPLSERVAERPAAAERAPVERPPLSERVPLERTQRQVAAPPRLPVEEDDLDDVLVGNQVVDRNVGFEPEEKKPRGLGKILLAAVLLAAVGGAAYAGWSNRTQIEQYVASLTSSEAPAEPAPATPAAPETQQAETPAAAPDPAVEPAPAAAPAPANGPVKLTQKLNEDGTETDLGPADGGAAAGEGTSVAAATPGGAVPPAEAPAQGTPAAEAPAETPPAEAPPAETPPAEAPPAETPPAAEAPATPAPAETPPAQAAAPTAETPAPAAPAPLAVGQKAIFYEEGTSNADGSANPGSIVWSVVQESPGAGQPPEPAIRAEATIPSKDLQLRMTIRRNADKTLPASHIIEMIFITPPNFEGGGVSNVLRVAMKSSEQDAGNPLAGIPARISDGFFLIALNDAQADQAQNLRFLQDRAWLDVPLQYSSGRRALITMEKGIPGDKVFTDVLKAWGSAG